MFINCFNRVDIIMNNNRVQDQTMNEFRQTKHGFGVTEEYDINEKVLDDAFDVDLQGTIENELKKEILNDININSIINRVHTFQPESPQLKSITPMQ